MALQLPRDEDGHGQTAVQRFWDTRSTPTCTSIGIDIDPEYCRMALRRLDSESSPLFAQAAIEYRITVDLLTPADVPAVVDKPASVTRPSRLRRPCRTWS